MIRFRTLGAVDLSRTGEHSFAEVLAHTKRLALLAYLAAALPRGFHRRDKLMALFWPELDAAHARGALRQALHTLRGGLGADVIVTRGSDEVALDPARCSSDAVAFEEAVRERDFDAAALALYRGDFLDGFYVPQASGFERWLDHRRGELGHAYERALEWLAERHAAHDRFGEAVECWRRLAEREPLNARIAVRLMEALEADGDPAGALQHARFHSALLAAELGAPPDPAVLRVAARLRGAGP
ncbi:MAG: BTAD domain-containing putative transcriptional regulator [Gemmatimonadaceae bacterium]